MDDGRLPGVGPGLAIAHEVLRRGDLDRGLIADGRVEILVDQPREDRRDEALEAHADGVDRRLVLVDHGA